VAKVEWHPGELYPRVGFIVTNLARPAERVVACYNQRGTAERGIKEDKARSNGGGGRAEPSPPMPSAFSSMHWAYNLCNFMRTFVLPKAAEPWSLKLARDADRIGVKVVNYGPRRAPRPLG